MDKFAVPTTPPRKTCKNAKELNVPQFNLPKGPATPQRTPQTKNQKLASSITPFKTPHKNTRTPQNECNQLLLTPQSLTKQKTLPTPAFTPAKSPIKSPHRSPRARRKRAIPDEIFAHSDSLASLLPTHSTVGSGRKTQQNASSGQARLKAPMGVDIYELSQINENLAFEEDPDSDDGEFLAHARDTSPSRVSSVNKKAKILATPGSQLISDEMVRSWHDHLFNGDFSSDDDADDIDNNGKITVVKPENPFVDNSNPPSKTLSRVPCPFSSPPSSAHKNIDFSTHSEFVSKTGERHVVELSESQRKFKPKKLNFDI